MSYFLELAQQYPHDAAAQLADQSNEIERLRELLREVRAVSSDRGIALIDAVLATTDQPDVVFTAPEPGPIVAILPFPDPPTGSK
jgi:hypothetical protein